MSHGSITVIGGGIIGLFSAYFLVRRGFDVTVVDKGSFLEGCSLGNAGMVVPSHFVPLAQPGMISKGIRWMFNPASPFYLRPKLDLALWQWAWRFYRSATASHVRNSGEILKQLNLRSKKLYNELELGEFGLRNDGLIMYCKSQKYLDQEARVAELAGKLNINADLLDAKAVQAMDPGFPLDVCGAVYYPQDAFLTPSRLMERLLVYLRSQGVRLLEFSEVTHWSLKNKRIDHIRTPNEEIRSDQYVLAAGTWSATLARKLGIKCLLQGGKGYSLDLTQPPVRPRYCSILTEAKVAVTPMSQGLRLAGTMEIAGLNHRISEKRVAGIKASVPDYFPAFSAQHFKTETVWSGLRPCSPDGLPYIGRSGKVPNLIVGSGHGMMGVSMAPGTGEIIGHLAAESVPSIDINQLSPDRFG